jgi:ubiquinone/menaquinone biosynthesis C-methylase UbiE
MYSDELAKKYVGSRDTFKETDSTLFEPLVEIGIVGKDILDFGCGDGRYAEIFLEMGAKSVIGIDVSPSMIEIANKRNKTGLKFLVADGAKLPFENKSFDIVFSNFVIHYFEDTYLPFSEISRVLRNNGHFVGTYNITKVEKGFENLYNTNMPIRLGKKESGVIVQNLIKSREEIESAIKNCGLKVLKEEILDHPNAVVDDSYEHIERIKKNAVLVVAQKI